MPQERSDDAALVARAVGGSEIAFRSLYRAYATPVYRIAFGLLADPRDAEDVTQETFVTAWRKLSELRLEGDSLLPWLATICRFQSANRVRARQRERIRHAPLQDPLPAIGDVETQVLDRQVAAAIAHEVAGLSEIDRAVFLLCVSEGFGYHEAAQRLGIPHGAVRNRLSRIRSRLRAGLRMEES